MLRTVTVFLACVAATGYSAPKPKSRDNFVAYTPTTVGDKWLIASDYGSGFRDVLDEIYEVTAVEPQHGALLVTRERRAVKGTARYIDKRKVCEAGEFLLEEGDKRYDPPVRLLPSPIKEKDTWKWEKRFVKWTWTAGPEEEVEVPAGKFKALRIDGVGEADGTPAKCTQWLVPRHPTIKTVLWLGNDKIVEVLKSFTPGKKE